ncbi:MAG: hypothetical protein ABI481_12950 [Pyrinomonadaceae bacterium]
MLKRLAAVLFIFVIAGQVSAGVCGCLGDESNTQHSCCKRNKLGVDEMRAPRCCDTNCAASASEKVAQDRGERAAKTQFKQTLEPAAVQRVSFQTFPVVRPVTVSAFSDHRLKYSRPPDLFLLNRAFLI